MREWIDIVEEALSADLIARVSPCTQVGRENTKKMGELKAEIEAEEQMPSSVPASYRLFGDDSEADDKKQRQLEYDLEKRKKDALERRWAEKQEKQRLQQAELDGYMQAGRDEYNDYMAKVKKFINKQAHKGMSAMEKQRKALAVMTSRQLKN